MYSIHNNSFSDTAAELCGRLWSIHNECSDKVFGMQAGMQVDRQVACQIFSYEPNGTIGCSDLQQACTSHR